MTGRDREPDGLAEAQRQRPRGTRGQCGSVAEPAMDDRVGAEPLQELGLERDRPVGGEIEMLRAQSVDRESVTEVCEQFGFSRESFYKIRLAFEEKGFNALFPAKKGRKGPVKLKGEMLEFALDRKRQDPDIDPARLSELIRERFGVRVHRTTVLRATKKKLPASAGQKRRKVHRER